MSRTPPEQAMSELLDRAGIGYTEQERTAGHRIDFTLHPAGRRILLDVNGDGWHRWRKIVDCDRVKIVRVLDAGNCPWAVWWSRLQRNPAQVEAAVRAMATSNHQFLPWWDWAVEIDSLPDRAAETARLLLARGKGMGF